MSTIRPISELRNNFNDVANTCNEEGEVFITRNGYGAYVLMTIEAYEEQKARLSLYHKLNEAEAQLQSGAEALSHEDVFGRLKSKYGSKK